MAFIDSLFHSRRDDREDSLAAKQPEFSMSHEARSARPLASGQGCAIDDMRQARRGWGCIESEFRGEIS